MLACTRRAGRINAAARGRNARLPDGLTLTFSREDDSESETNLYVDYTSDLFVLDDNSAQIPAGSNPDLGNGVSVTVTENDDDPDTVVVNIPAANDLGTGRLFARLRAEQQ